MSFPIVSIESEFLAVAVVVVCSLDASVLFLSFIDTLPLSLYWPANAVVSGLDLNALSSLLDTVLYIALVEYEGAISVLLLYKDGYVVSLL